MRKVTASAVILTAITGCSQSEAPSTEWSFDPPVDQQLTVEPLAFSSSGAFSSSKAYMGPAFEQPAGTKPSEATSLPLSDSSAVGQSTDQVIGSSNTVSSNAIVDPAALSAASAPQGRRADALSSVRTYLANVNGVRNRVPYSSQVYLPEAPLFTPSALASDSFANLPLFPEPADAAVSAPAPSADPFQSPASSLPVPELPAPSLFTPAPQSSQALTPFESATPSETVASNSTENFQDTLPVLPPALPTEGSVEISIAPQQSAPFPEVVVQAPISSTAEPQVAEPVSVGTAILQDLARDGDVEAMASLAEAEALPNEVSAESFAETGLPVVSQAPADIPTLDGLLSSMPSRESSPLLLARLADTQSSPIPAFDPAPLNLPVPTGLLPDASPVPAAEAASTEEFVFSEGAGGSVASDYQSPLLEGLQSSARSTAALSTVYVPIPEAEAADVTAEWIRGAIASLDYADHSLTPAEQAVAEPRDPSSAAPQIATTEQVEGDSEVNSSIRFVDVSDSELSRPTGMLLNRVPTEGSVLQKSTRPQKFSSRALNRRRAVQSRQRIVWQ
ncbi:MAG: hypothetical protein AAF810_08365 [Cyanobacteria bacterium P01_D01_bin.36]